MPPTRHQRLVIRRFAVNLALGPEALALGPAPLSLEPAPALALNNDLFQEFMRTCIKKVRDQVFIAPNTKIREDILDKLLKPRNLDLCYGNSHMECYYFCQQCEDHFEVTRLLGHKRVPFAARFLKDHIFN